MALLVWLPLNGNLNNQGLANFTPVQTTAPSWVNGKTSLNAMSTGALYLPAANVAKFYNNNAMSFCFWIYPIGTGSVAIPIIGQNNMTAGDNRMFTIFLYPTAVDLHLSWQVETTNGAFFLPVLTGAFTTNTWNHCAVVYNGTLVKIYINGTLRSTYSCTSTRTNFSYNVPIPSCSVRYLNDVRIYDHALSPKEVKEISKGLILHYPLNDVYNTSLVNKYSGDAFLGSGSGSYTKTKLANEIGYKYTYNYTGTGSDSWPNLYFANFAFTAGKTYQYSLYARYNSGNFNMTFRAARINNDWHGCSSTQFITDGQWHRYELSLYIDSTHTYSGTSYTNNPRIELYSPSLKTSGTVYTINFDIKFVQVVESDIKVPVIDNSLVTSTVHDTSGYNNNGTITGSLGLNNDSPKYDYGTIFSSYTNYITSSNIPTKQNCTISYWFKPDSISNNLIVVGHDGSHYVGAKGSSNMYNNGSGTSSKLYLDTVEQTTSVSGTAIYFNKPLQSGWHHYCFTNIDLSSWTKFKIGNYSSGWPINGKLSDFRVYATVLSADDVKELYDTAACIADNGSMFAYLYIESDITNIISDWTLTSLISQNGWSGSTAYNAAGYLVLTATNGWRCFGWNTSTYSGKTILVDFEYRFTDTTNVSSGRNVSCCVDSTMSYYQSPDTLDYSTLNVWKHFRREYTANTYFKLFMGGVDSTGKSIVINIRNLSICIKPSTGPTVTKKGTVDNCILKENMTNSAMGIESINMNQIIEI